MILIILASTSLELLFIVTANAQEKYKYSVAPTPWAENMGNHRAIITVTSNTKVAHLNFDWRRHDSHIEQRQFIIINAATNQRVTNIYRKKVTNERCEILFGPVAAGNYYFYYLPYNVDYGGGTFISKGYLIQEAAPDPSWVNTNSIPSAMSADYVEAICNEIQSRTDFDAFYPMEVIATESEKSTQIAAATTNFLLYPESRSYPIRMFDNIPQRWIVNPPNRKFMGIADRNEYFVFQVGLWAAKANISNVKVTFGPLSNGVNTIPASAMTCFNTGGIAPSGNIFTKTINVAQGKVQALWMGVDIPEGMPEGKYVGKLTVQTDNAGQQDIDVKITVTTNLLSDRGDSELWRHSRLRWLNSTAGIDNSNVPMFKPINDLDGGSLDMSGKKVAFASAGLPKSIKVQGEEVLAAPITFSILTSGSKMKFDSPTTTVLKHASGVVSKVYEQSNGLVKLKTTSVVEADGWMKYTFDIVALKNISISDIQLNIPYKKDNSIYMMGLSADGKATPDSLDAKWLASPIFDSFWLGSTCGGLHCELRGADYTGPLLNWYETAHPKSWYNNNDGGFKIRTKGNIRNVTAYSSGIQNLSIGGKITFECAFLITPVKPLDTYSQFTNRYYQNYGPPTPTADALSAGVNVINVHHGNSYNPYINFPFIAVEKMKEFVKTWHAKKVKTKIYYTLRMLSNHATEIWALKSLGAEVLTGGGGGGHPWLQEHFIENYDVQWYQRLDTLDVCNGIRTSTGESRYYNYYIEGLKWLVNNVDIDGLYLDDVAYGREMLKRIWKVVGEKKPKFMIDLHSHRGATGAPALQYAEFYPYIDKIWFGEDFHYNQMSSDNWLVETSGIPFGLMGDMLQDGGNPWLGMLYGMTARLPWMGNPINMWKYWDIFGIADSKMVGYWDKEPVVTTTSKDVLATTYIKDKKILISLASWANKSTSITLNIDFKRAGINPDNIKISAAAIEGFQQAKTFVALTTPIIVESKKGLLIVVEEVKRPAKDAIPATLPITPPKDAIH